MVAPLLIAGLGGLAGLGLGMGSSGGGLNLFSPDNLEFGTKKESYQITDTSQTTYSSTYSPVINRTFDIQYNIASGSNSSVTTKKDLSTTQEPSTSTSQTPYISIIPTTQQGGSSGESATVNPITQIGSYAVIAGIGFLAYTYLKGGKKK